MIHNVKMHDPGKFHNLFSLGRKIAGSVTHDALVLMSVLAAVSLVSAVVIIQTLFP